MPPVLEIDSGDIVRFDLVMAGTGQITPRSTAEDVVLDAETIYVLDGPVFVRGARPGQTLRVDVLHLRPGPWGWSMILPGEGLLPDDFPDPYLRLFDLTTGDRTGLAAGMTIPLAPFLGTMGVHPGEPDGELPFRPHRGGGNLDNRHLSEGASLWLPVWCEGALFSCGDPHAAQGDGEVCVTAIECDMQATLRFTVLDESIPGPRFLTAPDRAPAANGSHMATMGIGEDLLECSRKAVRGMIAWLTTEHGLTPQDAYLLCSLAGDLRIHEIVDDGVWNVGMMLPRSLLGRR